VGLSARDVSLLLHGSAEHCLIPRGLFTDTSQLVRFFSLLFLFSTVSFPRYRLILLIKVFDLIQNSISFHVV